MEQQQGKGKPTAAQPVAGASEPGIAPAAFNDDRSAPLRDPMRMVRAERAAAVAQIDRSLKVWRKRAEGREPPPAVVAAVLQSDVIHRTPSAKTPGTSAPPAAGHGAKPTTASPTIAARSTPAVTTPAPPAYDATKRSLDELWNDCADRVKRATALTQMVALGLKKPIVEKILAHDNGHSMRAFGSVAAEDSHTEDRHVLNGAGTIPDKKALALRVLRNTPPCPGKAGAFPSLSVANAAVKAALAAKPWKTLRNTLAKGDPLEEDIALATTGEVLVGSKVQAAALPPYAHPLGVGGRPLYPGDPEYGPEMAKLETPKGSGKHKKGSVDIVLDEANPLTTSPGVTGVHLRIIPDAGHDGGWFIHSAWPY